MEIRWLEMHNYSAVMLDNLGNRRILYFHCGIHNFLHGTGTAYKIFLTMASLVTDCASAS